MSLGNEIAVEQEIPQLLAWNDAKHGIWTTRDGRRIPIKAMTDRHIENCIRILEMNVDESDLAWVWVRMFKEELWRRELEL